MFVSTRPATIEELLPSPTAISWRLPSPPLPPHAPSSLIEGLHAFLNGERVPVSDRFDSNDVAGRLELDFIAGPDAESIRDRLGHRYLELARDLGHDPYFSKDGFLVQERLR